MKKILIIFMLCLITLTSCIKKGEDNTNGLKTNVDGKNTSDNIICIEQNGVVLAPSRPFLQALGLKDENIIFNEKSKSVQIKLNGKFIFLTASNQGVVIDTKMEKIEVAPVFKDNELYIPAEYTALKLGFKTKWDSIKKSLSVSK